MVRQGLKGPDAKREAGAKPVLCPQL